MIEIKQLRKISDHGASIDIDELVVEPGEIVAILGEDESGISLLFNLITGVTAPSSGFIRLDDVDPVDHHHFSLGVGVVFKDDCLYLRQTAYSNLALHCQLYGLPSQAAMDIMANMGMADQADKKLEKLSPGLKRRLAIGRACLHQPGVLIINEPFTRCDRESVELIQIFFQEFARINTSILIFAKHDDYLENFADRIYVMKEGHLELNATEGSTRVAGMPFFIPVKLEDKIKLINPGDIFYAEAVGDRTNLFTSEGRIATQYTLSELEKRLSRSGFFRTHRSFLVNLQHVSEVIPFTRNSYSLRLDDDSLPLIPLSRSSSSELKDLLGY